MRRRLAPFLLTIFAIGFFPGISGSIQPYCPCSKGKPDSLALFSSMSGDRAEIEENRLKLIEKAIQREEARWKVGKTSVSRLSLEEQKRLCGLKMFPDLEKGPSFPSRKVEQLPLQFDWRSHNGSDWTTPIKSQGNCGSCWAFGTLAALESLMEISQNNALLNPDLSEQYLLSCSAGSCDGWYLDSVLDFLKDYGTVDENCFPYYANDNIPCSSCCSDWQSRLEKISDWDWVGSGFWSQSPETIKEELLKGPLPTGMTIYEDFPYYVSGVYEHVWGEEVGGHLVTLVGWNDAGQYWICKNSWDTDWGENGWFKIRMGVDECDIEESTAYIRSEAGPQTTIMERPFRTLTGNTPRVEATFTWVGLGDGISAEGLTYSYFLAGYDSGWSSWLSETTRTYTLPRGSYTFKVRAKDGAGNIDPTPAEWSFRVSLPVMVYPNPCSLSQDQQVRIANISWSSKVKVQIHNLAGRLIKTLEIGDGISQEGGSATALWDGRNDKGERVAKGIYLYLILNVELEKKTGKIAIIK